MLINERTNLSDLGDGEGEDWWNLFRQEEDVVSLHTPDLKEMPPGWKPPEGPPVISHYRATPPEGPPVISHYATPGAMPPGWKPPEGPPVISHYRATPPEGPPVISHYPSWYPEALKGKPPGWRPPEGPPVISHRVPSDTPVDAQGPKGAQGARAVVGAPGLPADGFEFLAVLVVGQNAAGAPVPLINAEVLIKDMRPAFRLVKEPHVPKGTKIGRTNEHGIFVGRYLKGTFPVSRGSWFVNRRDLLIMAKMDNVFGRYPVAEIELNPLAVTPRKQAVFKTKEQALANPILVVLTAPANTEWEPGGLTSLPSRKPSSERKEILKVVKEDLLTILKPGEVPEDFTLEQWFPYLSSYMRQPTMADKKRWWKQKFKKMKNSSRNTWDLPGFNPEVKGLGNISPGLGWWNQVVSFVQGDGKDESPPYLLYGSVGVAAIGIGWLIFKD